MFAHDIDISCDLHYIRRISEAKCIRMTLKRTILGDFDTK
jgi:hypothetical protein